MEIELLEPKIQFDTLRTTDVKYVRNRKSPLRVVSLFSGCGGLDKGFLGGFEVFAKDNKKVFAKNPYEILWANDVYREAVETYKLNIGNHIVCLDINDVES